MILLDKGNQTANHIFKKNMFLSSYDSHKHRPPKHPQIGISPITPEISIEISLQILFFLWL